VQKNAPDTPEPADDRRYCRVPVRGVNRESDAHDHRVTILLTQFGDGTYLT